MHLHPQFPHGKQAADQLATRFAAEPTPSSLPPQLQLMITEKFFEDNFLSAFCR